MQHSLNHVHEILLEGVDLIFSFTLCETETQGRALITLGYKCIIVISTYKELSPTYHPQLH